MTRPHPSGYRADRAPAFASQAVSAALQNPEISRIQTAYAVVFPAAFAASALRRAEIASKAASFACSIDEMA